MDPLVIAEGICAGDSRMSTQLERRLGFWLLSLYGLGNILGAGIYVLIGKVAGEAGFLAPWSFLLASIVAGFTAFTYAELSARFPVAAGEAVYLHEAFGFAPLSGAVGLLISLAGMLSAAAIARGFAGYAQVYLALPDAVLTALVIIALGALAAWGISQSVSVAAVFTLVEIAGLLAVIGLGLLHEPELSRGFDAFIHTDVKINVIVVGAFLAFYAYIGFEDMVNIAEEVRDPEHTMPRAIIFALLVSTLLYAGVAFVAIALVPPDKLAMSAAPLADVFRATGVSPLFITFVGLFAVVNGALIQIIMAARILYGMGKRHWLPSVVSRVSPRTHTPLIATMVVTAVVVILALWFPLKTLAAYTSYLILTVFFLINLSLLVIRRSPPPGNIVVYPAWVPVGGMLTSAGLFLGQLLL